MINQGSYKPVINRSPDEQKYGGSNLLKQQYKNYSKQNIASQFEDESNSENPFSGEIKFGLAENSYNNLNNGINSNATAMGNNNDGPVAGNAPRQPQGVATYNPGKSEDMRNSVFAQWKTDAAKKRGTGGSNW